MIRCHTSSPKGKGQNLISSNSVAWVYIPSIWLENPNVHRFLKQGHLATPALPKIIFLIFLWAELPRRDLIPIVNQLLYTLYIVEGRWGAHFYLYLPKNNKETDCFWNRLISLCWLVHNVMTNWKCFGRINDVCSLTWIVDRHLHVYYLNWWPTNSKRRVVM